MWLLASALLQLEGNRGSLRCNVESCNADLGSARGSRDGIDGALVGVFLFSPLDGAMIDGIETGSGIAMGAATLGRRAYVMSNGGQMLGLYVSPPPGAIVAKPR